MTVQALKIAGAALVIFSMQSSASLAEPDSDPRGYKLQIGPHVLASWNIAEPLLDISKTWDGEWRLEMQDGTIVPTETLREMGVLNEANDFPQFMPEGGKSFIGPVILQSAGLFPDTYADQYVLEWEGAGYGFLQGQSDTLQRRKGAHQLNFGVRYQDAGGRTVRFARVRDGGVSDLKVYRSKYADLVKEGKIWNPRHVDHMRQYDVVRTMDYQSVNASPVTRFEQVAKPEDAAWDVGLQLDWPAPPRYGAPYEALFDLGMEADVSLWMTFPTMIGAPFHLADPALRATGDASRVDPDKISARARAHADEILASPEWERFAGAVIDRMIASGYPEDRPLYLELGNEIWNTAGGYAFHTRYAEGIGKAQNPDWGVRQGYGVLSARWATAFVRELKRRERKQEVVFVLSGQTAWPGSSEQAIMAFKQQLGAYKVNNAAILKNTGVAVTTYHSCSRAFTEQKFGPVSDPATVGKWEKAIDDNTDGLMKELHDFCTDGPANAGYTVNWVLAHWREHAKIAERADVRFLGAYEGGTDDSPPQELKASKKFKSFWKAYYWGPQGADVVRQLNRRLIAEYPGVILSNYIGIGVVGETPWGDGHYDHDTALMSVWREFSRSSAANQ